MNSKPFYQSKTIAGAVMMLVAIILQVYQVDIPADQQAAASASLENTLEGAAGFIGFLFVVWGRVKASRSLRVSP